MRVSFHQSVLTSAKTFKTHIYSHLQNTTVKKIKPFRSIDTNIRIMAFCDNGGVTCMLRLNCDTVIVVTVMQSAY